MNTSDFTTSPEPQELNLIELYVRDLGFPSGATVRAIYDKAKELGLEPVPPETGPHFRLAYTDQPDGEWILIGMNPIPGFGGDPGVFHVVHGEGGLGLLGGWATPGYRFGPGPRVLFRPSK